MTDVEASGPLPWMKSTWQNITEKTAAGLQLNAADVVVNATVLGSTGVGKTSLLASMHRCFNEVTGNIDLDVLPDPETNRSLGAAITKLQELPTSVTVHAMLPGTVLVKNHKFEVGVRGRKPSFTLRITDYPGAYFLSSTYEDRGLVEEALAQSDVLMLAIDAPALMHDEGEHHQFVNQPDILMNEIRRLLSATTEPRLLILALLKCETYMTDVQSIELMEQTVLKQYRPLLDYIASEELRDRVGCVLTAVQTVGSVHLLDVETDDGEPKFKFRATAVRGAKYAPLDVEQPLRYLMRFVVNKYRSEKRAVFREVYDRLSRKDRRLADSIQQFAAGCKTAGGFAVLQQHKFLDPPTARPAGRR